MVIAKIRYIYRITNLVNGKTYIGQRTPYTSKLEEDNYYGSGKLIKLAEQKYGLENFKKEILISGLFSKEEIDKLEISYILKEKENGHGEYNISLGGQQGGDMGPEWRARVKEANQKSSHKQKISESLKAFRSNNPEYSEELLKKAISCQQYDRLVNPNKYKSFLGKKHSDESKQKMRNTALQQDRTGSKNGSFGKRWFTNGIDNVKSAICPDGFWKGRVLSINAQKAKKDLLDKKIAKQKFKEDLISRILNSGIDLQAYNVYSLLAKKLGMSRTFLQNFVKRNMQEYRGLFYDRKKHMS